MHISSLQWFLRMTRVHLLLGRAHSACVPHSVRNVLLISCCGWRRQSLREGRGGREWWKYCRKILKMSKRVCRLRSIRPSGEEWAPVKPSKAFRLLLLLLYFFGVLFLLQEGHYVCTWSTFPQTAAAGSSRDGFRKNSRVHAVCEEWGRCAGDVCSGSQKHDVL